MTASALLQALQARQIRLWAEGDALHYDAPAGVMTDELKALVRAHKAALLALLRQEKREWQEERVAIMEYDGGMSRPAADALAKHGAVVALPACPQCHGMSYQYEDGHVRCTTPWCGKEERPVCPGK
jgi:hypothetical protein